MPTLQTSIVSMQCSASLGHLSFGVACCPFSVRKRDFSSFHCTSVARPTGATGFKLSHSSQNRLFQCSGTMSPKNNGDFTQGSDAVDAEFVNSSVLDAVEVKHESGDISIRTRDGRHLKCVSNNRRRRHPPPDYASHSTIFLKIEDDSNLLLPIFALDWHSALLREAMRNVYLARPTIYQVLRDLIRLAGFQVKSVRVTKRLHDAYFAKLQLAKQIGDESQEFQLDLHPSDAINIAIRCQAPIQVHRLLAYVDGVKILNDPGILSSSRAKNAIITELDKYIKSC